MNYSNIAHRVRRVSAAEPVAEMVLCRESDRRTTNLRVRKASTASRRAAQIVPATAALLLALAASADAQFRLDQAAGLFSPGFRDTLTIDGGQTTYFGWTGNIDGVAFSADDGGFDGATLNELIDNPAVLRGAGGLDGTLNQVGTADILASSKNIFAGDFLNASIEAHLTLQIPTNGTPGLDGFTTIVLQGVGSITNTGTQLPATPGPIVGVSPTFIYGPNTNRSRQQWWAKYEIPGNAASYTVDITLPAGVGINPTSIRELIVDTQFSTTGFAPDTAAVPEAGSSALFITAGLVMLARRRRK